MIYNWLIISIFIGIITYLLRVPFFSNEEGKPINCTDNQKKKKKKLRNYWQKKGVFFQKHQKNTLFDKLDYRKTVFLCVVMMASQCKSYTSPRAESFSQFQKKRATNSRPQ